MGGEVKLARLYSRIQTTVFGTGYTQDTVVLPINLKGDSSGRKFAAYIQVSQTIGDLDLELGIRGDYFSMIKDKGVIAPRFSASYALTPVTKLRVSAGRFEQSPSYIWLMANPYNRGLTYIGMDQYTVGVERYLESDLSVSIQAYRKTYDHYPVSLTRPYLVMANTGLELQQVFEAYASFGLDFLQSSGTGESRGIELFLQKRLSEVPLFGKLSVTYSESEFTSMDGTSHPSSNDQRWKVAVSCGYIFDEQWEATSTFRLYTGRPYTPFTSSQWLRTSVYYNSARVGLNHSLDLRVVRRWMMGSIAVSTFLDIQNVYDRKPLDVPQWNQTKAQVEYPPSLGIVPSIGVSVEF
jgi:outer membrane cobalamin receptor